MDIDDEFARFMKLTTTVDVPVDSEEWAVHRVSFFSGMFAMYFAAQRGETDDVYRQLSEFMDRAGSGKEPGFTQTDFTR